MRLQGVLDHFSLKHVDYMSVDCERCEERALASLDFNRTTIDALNIERPSCAIVIPLVHAGYVVLGLWWHNDVAFVHARVARQIPPGV